MANLKLALGQHYSAWKSFPQVRSALNHFPKGPPILVTGAYRSGTTWVANMLAGAGLWHLHEPFNPHHRIWPEYFSYRRAWERDDRLDEIAENLLSGRMIGLPGLHFLKGIHANRFGMPARLGFYQRAIQRVLIKDPIGCLLSEYLVRNFGMTAVVVLRHPAGFVSSLVKLQWNTADQLRRLLNNQRLMEDWLHRFEHLMSAAADTVDIRSHATLYSCLWHVLWGFSRRNGECHIINYERLCERPEKEFSALARALKLPMFECDRERQVQLTRGVTAVNDSGPFCVERNTQSMRRVWQRRLVPAEIDVVRNIWGAFDLPLFLEDGDWN